MLTKMIAEIVTETGFSKPTVLATLAAMERHDIIRRKTGVIFLNPNTVFKGSARSRRALLIEYLQLKSSASTNSDD
ncbi:replication/maintenance protein RepL [uncultured Nostoc sp.]|uniref:replication/maintenance protein RepL n=1 Tax=uncultured Nostoc sp. TaxID=340711 RepID=UPI0025D189D9|nr:replication/maintenance protein RepL [Nostoc sp. LPT]